MATNAPPMVPARALRVTAPTTNAPTKKPATMAITKESRTGAMVLLR